MLGEIAGGAGSKQVLFPAALKEGGRLAGKGRQQIVVVNAVFVGYLGIGVRKRGADHLKVRALVPDIGLFRLLVHVQAEIAAVHLEGVIKLVDVLIRPLEAIGLQHNHKLGDLRGHDLDPADIFPGLLAVDDMGPVDAVSGVQRLVEILGRRDQQPQILPVV